MSLGILIIYCKIGKMEKFNFSWSEYRSQSKTLLENIFNGEIFHDVTLVTDDEQMIKSHKVVLAASSEYFQRLLSVQAHPHPMIVLKGVKSQLLNSILKFLYLGETSVHQTEIEEFVKTSKYLKIKGLDSGKDKSEEDTKPLTDLEDQDESDKEVERRVKEVYDLLHSEESNDSVPDEDLSSFQEILISKQSEHIEINLEDDEDSNDGTKQVRVPEEDILVEDDVMELENNSKDEYDEPEIIYCDRCDFETNTNEEYQNHLAEEHANDIPCKDCDFNAKDKAGLKEHMLKTHKGVRCNNCDEKFSDLSIMRKHILSSEACMANLF